MEGKTVARLLSKSPLVLLALLVVVVVASCGPDKEIGYQGRLTDSSGRPINGTKSITFRLWTDLTGGDKVFEQTQSVGVTNGLMNVDLGAGLTDAYGLAGIDPGIFARPLWLEIAIDGETLSPRQKLLGAPYAMSMPQGAVVGGQHQGNGGTTGDITDMNYGSLTVVASNGGTALVVGIAGSPSPGDALRICRATLSARDCGTSDANLIARITNTGQGRSDVGWTTPAADFAEMIRTEPSAQTYSPGDVLAISSQSDRAVTFSSAPYSTSVVGVYSTKPGFVGGTTLEEKDEAGNNIPVALVGIVPVKVSAENGAIHRGDLLTTSSTPGHAMKATEFRVGTILGKAMGELEEGTGLIEVLLTLQ